MNNYADKTQKNKRHSDDDTVSQRRGNHRATLQDNRPESVTHHRQYLVDNRPESVAQAKWLDGIAQKMADCHPSSIQDNREAPAQSKTLRRANDHPQSAEELLQGKFQTAQFQQNGSKLLNDNDKLRTHLAKHLSITDKTHKAHGSNYDPKNDTPQKVLDNLLEPVHKSLFDKKLNDGVTEIAQLQPMDEEELIQGKFKTTQLQRMDEVKLLQKEADSSVVPNNTGLPNNLKSGIENLSGYSLDDVKVHYNSSKPATLQAHAYAQGTEIHIAPGQEKHLPHEAWHVVQQKQGRVKPTLQMKGGTIINDDTLLEKEADVMGAKSLSIVQKKNTASEKLIAPTIVQLSEKYDQITKKTETDNELTDDEIIEATKELIGEIVKNKNYKDSEGNILTPESINDFNILFGEDYAASPGLIDIPSVAIATSDIKKGIYKTILMHEMSHYIRTIGSTDEDTSFPQVSLVLSKINWSELVTDGGKPELWKEESRADLKAIQIQFEHYHTILSDDEIDTYGLALGNVVDASHPPAEVRVSLMKKYAVLLKKMNEKH